MSANDERAPDGNFVLRQALTPTQKRDLAERAKTLAPFLEPAKPNFIKNRLIAMFMKFGGASASLEEAKVVAASYIDSLNDLPLWAIETACRRFGNGEVSAAEIKEQELSRTFRPSAPQVRMVARDHLKVFAEESTRIWMTLRGTPARDKTINQATRDRVTAEVMGAVEGMRLRSATERAEESQRVTEARRSATERANRHQVMRQYSLAGVEPPEGPLQSLSLLLSVGWSIQDDGRGGRVLVKPPPEPERTLHKGESM